MGADWITRSRFEFRRTNSAPTNGLGGPQWPSVLVF